MLGSQQQPEVHKNPPTIPLDDSLPTFKVDFGADSGVQSPMSAGGPGDQTPSGQNNMNIPAQFNIASPVVREFVAKRREMIRPWGSFIKTSNFEVPASPAKWTTRFYKNIEHFQSNYVFVFLILFLYCLITSPFLLVAMAASGGACWYAGHRNQDRKLILGGKEVPLAQQYAAIGVISIPLFVIAGAGGAVFWVIGASIFVVALHATFYNYDALEINDQQPLTGNIVEEV